MNRRFHFIVAVLAFGLGLSILSASKATANVQPDEAVCIAVPE